MDRLQSQHRNLCAWLSEDPDYILDQCGDLLTANEYKAVLECPVAHLKVGALLYVFVKKGRSACESFTDVLRQHQAHYRHLWRFFGPSPQGPIAPAVFADKGSVVSANELTDVRGESFSNKVEIARAPHSGSSGLADELLPRAGLVASGSSVILADRITGGTFNGDVSFSVCVKAAQTSAGTFEEVRSVPQGPAVRAITEHKVALIDCLRGDPLILQHAHASRVLTDVQYQNLRHSATPAGTVTDLLDAVIRKGQDTCALFLQVLQKPDVLDTYPQLRDILSAL